MTERPNEGDNVMRMWSVVLALILPLGISFSSFAQTPEREKEIQAVLEKQGYTNVRDIKFGPEGITAHAAKDARETIVMVDSNGNVKEWR